ncbi:helix-turn-helix domain-containing protein [Sphingobium phenoxybenzoativorans]|uniref:helix-turn-helix domain-containing protein n=1 Tax=Sphingobium phenoxybenzoativorans TaxID=1592790 RepID=UPI001FE61792|nr:helix-turn-helix domain-containing protein [Sphingobium phenoxybenzoativorans]
MTQLPRRCLPLVSEIQRATCFHFGIEMGELLGKDRSSRLAHPRQMAMFLARELTPNSLPDIGRRFGGRDHSTVVHAIAAVRRRATENYDVAREISELSARVAAIVAARPDEVMG